MTSDWRPGHSEPRATDGLDWSLPNRVPTQPTPSLPAEPLPGAHQSPARPPGPGGGRIVLAAGLGGIIGGAIAGALVALAVSGGDDGEAGRSADTESTPVVQEVLLTTRVADVATAARQSVVRIESTRRTAAGGSASDVGSGVLIDSQGHVVTNAHVVLGTDSLSVVLADGQRRSAALIGHDYPFTDLAVLLVGPTSLPPLAIGDSSQLRPGDTIIAIGNPLAEFDGTVTVGVVSGTNRQRVFDDVLQEDLIQIDAPVNHGNSGGALVSLAGDLVGLPTAVIRESQGQAVEGLAFALPANRVRTIAEAIIAAGADYPRPSLGAELVDLTPDVLARLPRLPVNQGALVTTLDASGPAATAGLQVGDIVVEIEDRAVDREHRFLNVLSGFESGTTVTVVFNRNGRIIETDVRLTRRS